MNKKSIYKLTLTVLYMLMLPPNTQAEGTKDEVKQAFEILKRGIVSEDIGERSKAADALLKLPSELRETIKQMFELEYEKLVNTLPQKIDANTTLTSVVSTPDNVAFLYSVNLDVSRLKSKKRTKYLDDLESQLEQQAINQMCSIPLTAMTILFGKKIIRLYMFEDGRKLASITVDWKNCENRNSKK